LRRVKSEEMDPEEPQAFYRSNLTTIHVVRITKMHVVQNEEIYGKGKERRHIECGRRQLRRI
jgi:hypothetical protein